jgi:ribosomal protein L29
MSKAKEFVDLSQEELEAKIIDLRKDLFKHRCEHRQGQKAEKPHFLRITRRDVARALTVLKQKQESQTAG